MKTLSLALMLVVIFAVPALAADAASTRATSLADSVSALGERVALLEREIGEDSVRLASSGCCDSSGWENPFSGSVTLRSQFSRQGGKDHFSQRLGFELNYFKQISDEIALSLSLAKPLSAPGGLSSIGLGGLDDDLRFDNSFFKLQSAEMQTAVEEDAK